MSRLHFLRVDLKIGDRQTAKISGLQDRRDFGEDKMEGGDR